MTPTTDADAVLAALRDVIDPELGADIVELEMVRDVTVADDGAVTVRIGLTTAGCPLRAQIQRDARGRVEAVDGVTSVRFDFVELTAEQKARTMDRARRRAAEDAEETAIPPSARVLAVASGKGGVGKSSVTVNLAVALARRGCRVGVIDADIWGFSVPRMLGLDNRLEAVAGDDGRARMKPAEIEAGNGHLFVVSMGLLVEGEESALLWRGLMLNRAVQHFLEDVDWPGDLDYVLVDMPPGTGDVAMGMARMLPRTELLVVTTPAVAAQKVAARAVTMARKNYLRVAGVIENLSTFVAPDGSHHDLFGSGGGAELAHFAGVELLGSIPIEPAVSGGGDAGRPVAFDDEGPAAVAFAAIAERIVDEVAPPASMAGCTARLLAAAESALNEFDRASTPPGSAAS